MANLSDLLAGIWVLFWIYWFVAAIGVKKNTAFPVRGAGIRLGIFILAFVLIRSSTSWQNSIGNPAVASSSIALSGAGFVVFLAGLLLAIWARLHLGKNWGMPMTWKRDPELVTSGPYSYIRHPIYSGVLLAMLGSSLVSGVYWLILFVVVGGYFLYVARVEEKNMLRQFPGTYPAYRAKTKMLIPFIL